ncbi:MAG TPA: hypothetical protein VNT03_11150 [Baekduia sp.]|nr:hypothetical protein [Baekduia sp.]
MLVAAAARAHRREEQTVASLIDEVFAGVGLTGRVLPDSITRTLETLDAARRAPAVATTAS